ncbi:unnamed protein product, partial [Iphiclides podalirius]
MKSDRRPKATPASIVIVNCGIIEVAVQGKKLGVIKKHALLKTSSLCISKYNIYRRFIEILRKNMSLQIKLADGELESMMLKISSLAVACSFNAFIFIAIEIL